MHEPQIIASLQTVTFRSSQGSTIDPNLSDKLASFDISACYSFPHSTQKHTTYVRCQQGFSDVFDIRVLREAELKHGRFAMLAVLGFLVQEKYTLPFFPHIAPVDAHDYFVQQGGGSQIIFWISFVEIFGVVALFETLQVSSHFIPSSSCTCVCVLCPMIPTNLLTLGTD